MDGLQKLIQHLQEHDPYPCLDLLEAAVQSRKFWPGGTIPKELVTDIRTALGDSVFHQELAALLELGILEDLGAAPVHKIKLVESACQPVDDLLRRMAQNQDIETDNGSITTGDFLAQFVEYLQNANAEVSVLENERDSYLLELGGKKFRLVLAFSPFWLPLAPAGIDEGNETESFVIGFGPFATRPMNVLYHYFDLEEFRGYVAFYDLWSRVKWNLAKAEIMVYLDWFFRDQFKSKFYILPDFCETLHDMGLLRYNDEY